MNTVGFCPSAVGQAQNDFGAGVLRTTREGVAQQQGWIDSLDNGFGQGLGVHLPHGGGRKE